MITEKNKVMGAPEKIYFRKRNKLPLQVLRDKWYETDPQNIYGSVEYTRTDAFIEKACEWLKRNTILAETTIERFKQAMKE